jgi:HAD superfamily hydrolase (TIGR01509 family)
MPEPQVPPTVIFDIDGTLVDSNYLHTLAWRRAMLDHGHDVASWRIHRMIGAASEVLLQELLGDQDPEVADGWKAHFDVLRSEIRAFPGAADLLRAIAGRGGQVVLASSSPGELVDGHLEAIGAGDAIAHVLSDADVEQAKPSPEVFEVALGTAGAQPDRSIVVGDAPWDVESAARAGLATVGVLSGGYSRAELVDAGAVAAYDDVAALLAELDSSPVGRLLDPAGTVTTG